MIKYFLLLLLFSVVSVNSTFSQIRRIYIQSQKERDSIRNHTHFKKTKLSDSAWFASEYYANDTLKNSAIYKDEDLQIPDGKFKLYGYTESHKDITYDYVIHKSDTIMVPAKKYLTTVGFFKNGKRTGLWHTYQASGELTLTEVFKDNKLDGPYQTYNAETGKVLISGNYSDNIPVGNWDMLSFNGGVMTTDVYEKGKVVKTISHMSEKKFEQKITGGKPKYDMISYLNHKLANTKFDTPGVKMVLYSVIEDKEGKLTKPSVIKASDLATDTAIIDAMLEAPNWQPAYKNGQLIDLSIPFNFEITISENKHLQIVNKSF